MTTINRSAIVVRPRQPFLDWLRWADPTAHDLSLEDLCEEPSVYLIPESQSEEDLREHLTKLCGRIFEEQLDGWYRVPSTWPNQRDMETFERWFELSFHSIVIDLCAKSLRRERL
jgi:hypothetical protein